DLETVMSVIKNEKRLYMIGTLKISDINRSSLSKISNLLRKKSIKGFKIFPGHDPIYPTDRRWIPILKLCLRYNLPLIIHTGMNVNNKESTKYNDPKHIIKVAKNYPKLKIIIAHYFWPKQNYCFSITNGFDNIYFDISGLADPEVIKFSDGIKKIRKILVKTVKRRSDSVIFGTDWPMCNIGKHINLVNSLNITKNEKDKIFYKNALKLFGLK
ncbi:hypothetical protein LCGC14_2386670, partial [marine sediment metagenome]